MKIVEAGGRCMFKTTTGGLLVQDKEKQRTLKFDLTSDDLLSLAKSLKARERDNK